MIKPTVGRILHFYAVDVSRIHGDGPRAAIITYVFDERFVNLTVFMPDGRTEPRTNVELIPGNDSPPPLRSYCRWMDYQVGQAAKTEALQTELDEAKEQP